MSRKREQPVRTGGREEARRAFAEFLAFPSAVIVAFLALAVGTHELDQIRPEWLEPIRTMLQKHIFANSQQTGNLLGTVASGVITVTSITFSLLLLSVQQTASTMTQQVVDQYLRRWPNQFYFGFFVGLGMYALAVLATVNPPFNPVMGGVAALLLTGVGLYMLLLLLYSTLDQMLPPVIVRAIHDRTLAARTRQRQVLACTRRKSRLGGAAQTTVRTEQNGFVVGIDFDALGMRWARPGVTLRLTLRLICAPTLGRLWPLTMFWPIFAGSERRTGNGFAWQ